LFDKIKNPIRFQGSLKKQNYFEGWYFKQVSADEKNVISFIPGISLLNDDPHCFVQYIFLKFEPDGRSVMTSGYCRYPVGSFRFQDDPFKIEVGGNVFTESFLSVHLEDGSIKITGRLEYGRFTPIRQSFTMPNIMGYFAYIPGMECYHGIISMEHCMDGILEITGRSVDFGRGKGYLEKDWGTSFPEKYIWIQCNLFKNNTTSILLSIAKIPFLHMAFQGFLANITMDGKEYRFATYNSSRMRMESVTDRSARITMENKAAKIEVEALIQQPGELIAPEKGKMKIRIKEELSGVIHFTLYDKQTRKTYTDVGRIAGIEIVGYTEPMKIVRSI